MSLWNEVLEGSLNQLLAKRLGMQVGSPSPAVAPELMPTLALEVDRLEWGYLKDERPCAGRAVQAAVAGVVSTAILANPANSGTLVVVETIEVQNTGTNLDVILHFAPTATLVTLGPTTPRDSRFSNNAPTTNTVAILSHDATAALPVGGKNVFRLGTTALGWQPFPFVLKPGTALEVRGITVNVALIANFQWRERAAQPGELGL